MKKVVQVTVAAAMACALAACGSSSTPTPATTAAGTTAAAAAADSSAAEAAGAEAEADTAESTTEVTVEQADAEAPGAAGFEEIPIFEDEEAGFMNVSAVYFQPVPMSSGNESIEGFDLHLEADVSALENAEKLGFGPGDWIPYMTVDYAVTSETSGDVAAEGTFMVMSASDGPHYGANIALPDADTYTLKFTFHSPEENGYLLHLDDETGPGGTFDEFFGDGPLTVEVPGWKYVPQEW